MKNLKSHSIFILVLLLIVSCNNPKNKIKKDIKSRFTKFEIIEIKEDSSNIYTAFNMLRSLKVKTSDTNLEIIKTLKKIENSTREKEIYNNYIYIDSIYENLTQSFDIFEKSRFDKSDKCYYVKYLLHKDELKIPIEEYYHLRLMPNGKYDIIHRPYDWDLFLYEEKYDLLIKNALRYKSEIYELELKYKKN